MEPIEIKYRTWHKAVAPRPIKLQIPGWAGENTSHSSGNKPQPWHCPPFVDGSTYGLELIYPFESECRIYLKDNKVIFEGDFSEEQKDCQQIKLPPFMTFADNHFGMTSALDIKVPQGYILRTECHPRFYTDVTNTVPCCLPGHIQTEWWPKIFFVVFKNPMPGQTIIFRKDEPYGQILVLPRKVQYDINKMSSQEILERTTIDDKITRYGKKFSKSWQDNLGQVFDDKYKVLSSVYSKNGYTGVKDFLDAVSRRIDGNIKFLGKFIKRKK